MSKEQLKDIVKKLANLPISAADFKKHWNILLSLLDLTHSEIVNAIVNALESPGEDLGLTQAELVSLARKIGLDRITDVISKKISPEMQKKNADLFEQAFTSTANVAAYPVPLGSKMLRRKDPTGKKRKK